MRHLDSRVILECSSASHAYETFALFCKTYLHGPSCRPGEMTFSHVLPAQHIKASMHSRHSRMFKAALEEL